jgi:tRNA(fMet)-specific endonuclease VapC
MSGKYLLDTNIIIALFNGDKIIPLKLDEAELVGISVVVIGELLYGAKKSKHVKDNIAKIRKFVSRCSIFFIDSQS